MSAEPRMPCAYRASNTPSTENFAALEAPETLNGQLAICAEATPGKAKAPAQTSLNVQVRKSIDRINKIFMKSSVARRTPPEHASPNRRITYVMTLA